MSPNADGDGSCDRVERFAIAITFRGALTRSAHCAAQREARVIALAGCGGRGEKDAKLAQTLGQLQPCISWANCSPVSSQDYLS